MAHHPAWREVAVRVCGSDRAESDCDYAQSLWRSVLRYVVKAHPHRRELRLAERRNRGDGAEGAVDIVYKRELDGAENREAVARKRLKNFAIGWPILRGSRSRIRGCSYPARETRKKLIQALAMLETKRDKNR